MSHPPVMLRSTPARCPLTGTVTIPGDKSISHRALMFGGLAVGTTRISGLLEGEDVLRTAQAMRQLGAEVVRGEDGVWQVSGRGLGALQEPDDILDLGNSGTSARLLMGILGSHPLTAVITGDASLRGRPMGRVATPLTEMGARLHCRSGQRLPLMIQGTDRLLPLRYRLPVASAQVKSCILLAGLNTPGETTVIEPEQTRDHTEKMLAHFGADVRITDGPEGREVTVVGQPELTATDVLVPADPSSAAFPVVAALLTPGSEIRLPAIGMNPHRNGLYLTLRDMGAEITWDNERLEAGEPVADLVVTGGPLRGIEVPATRAPAMIDEYPILAVAAAFAEGTTIMRGIGELRVKESDRLAAVAAGLTVNGIKVEESADCLIVHGCGHTTRPAGGGTVDTHFDHRIAMSFLVMGTASENPITVRDAAAIDTSFPGFAELMNGLGARIAPED